MYSYIVLAVYAAILLLMSFVTFILFSKDKKMAQSGGGPVRIKEKTLLASVALGGSLGGFIGRKVCHHKTDKKYFSFTIYVSMLFQIAVLALMVVLAIM